MRTERRNTGPNAERGFTLVETVVALSVFGVTLIPTTSVFFGGVQAAAISNVRADAVSIAASTLAEVQALPYNLVGFYSAQSGYTATCPSSVPACSGQSTVLLGAATPAGAFAPLSPPPTVGATTFTVTTYITWSDAKVPSGTCLSGSSVCAQAYKQVTAVISWGGRNRMSGSVTETTIVYPGGQGKWTAAGGAGTPGSTCPGNPTTPSGIGAAANANPGQSPDPGEFEVNVSWNPVAIASEPCYYVIDSATASSELPTTCSNVGTVQASPWQPGTAYQYVVTGLTPGTTYYFDVIAFNSDGSQCAISAPASATTVAAAVAPSCNVTAFTVTAVPSQSAAKTYENANGTMSDNLNLVASSTGTCSGLTVQSHLVNSSSQDPGSPYTLTAGTSGQFTYAVPSQNVAWTTGQHVFTVYLNGAATTQQQSLEVCAHAGNGQKTSTPNACP